jgi:hypothetical protein
MSSFGYNCRLRHFGWSHDQPFIPAQKLQSWYLLLTWKLTGGWDGVTADKQNITGTTKIWLQSPSQVTKAWFSVKHG